MPGDDSAVRCPVGGFVSGLNGKGLILQNNLADDVEVTSNGRFTFADRLLDGSSYAITVQRQPEDPDQTCRVVGGIGVVRGRSSLDARVICSPWTRLLSTFELDQGSSIAADRYGHLYIVGTTLGSFPDHSSSGLSDAFLAKLAANGNQLWMRQFGTANMDGGEAVAVNAEGDIYIAGVAQGTLVQDGDVGEGPFLAKYDPSGNRLWVRQQNGRAAALGLALDQAGSAYLVGYTSDELDGNLGLGDRDAFIIKYDALGSWEWTRQFGTTGEDFAYGVTVDGQGRVLVAGFVSGGLDGAPYVGEYGDIFVAAYDALGNRLWSHQRGTARDDHARAIVTDRQNNIYLTGVASDPLDENVDSGMFVMKYSALGDWQWTRQLGPGANARAIAVDDDGFVYATGSWDGSFDDPPRFDQLDIILVKLDAGGTTQWSRKQGSSGSDYGLALAFDSAGDLFVTGNTTGPLDGHAPGSGDAFVMKFDRNGEKQ